MPHLVLLGDSIFDNGAYTGGGPDVIAQVRQHLPAGWRTSLLAVDGATTQHIPAQLARLPADATHLALSIGGNDALGNTSLLDMPANSSAQVLHRLADAVDTFEATYRKALARCLQSGLPLVACTIYNGNFPDREFQRRATIALATFNDAIVRAALEQQITLIELRQICKLPEDFANPIEPSSIGGDKIARALVRTITHAPESLRGARIVGDA